MLSADREEHRKPPPTLGGDAVADVNLVTLIDDAQVEIGEAAVKKLLQLAGFHDAGSAAAARFSSGLRHMSRNSSPMPMQIAESATLNAGQ